LEGPISDQRVARRTCRSAAITVALRNAAVLMFLILSALQAARPLHLDNMDFPALAQAISESGIPIYYRGEDNPRHIGIYHPPLYAYTLAAWVKVFGRGAVPVRLFGVICALILAWTTILTYRTLFGRAEAARVAPWFWVIFLLNPYTLESAAIADIDTSIYGPLLVLFLWSILRLSWRDGEWRVDDPSWPEMLLPAGIMLLCLWAKLTTIILLVPFSLILLFGRFRLRRALAITALVNLLGTLSFLISYRFFGWLTHLDTNYTFAFTWMSFTQRGSSGNPGIYNRLLDRIGNLQTMLPITVTWTGLVPWLALAVELPRRAILALNGRDKRSEHYSYLLGIAALTFVYYCSQVMTFGHAPFKYTFVFWGLALWPLAVWAAECNFTVRNNALIGSAVLCVFLFLGFYKIRDYVVMRGFSEIWALEYWAVGALFCVSIGLFEYRPKLGISRWLLIVALAAYVGTQFGVAALQARAPYSTTYDYGQTGFEDTVAFVRTTTGPDDVIVSMKDIGFSAERRYIENYSGLYGDEVATRHLTDAIASGKVKLIIFTEGFGQDQLIVNPRLQSWIDQHCSRIGAIGNYRLYRFDR
jgi:hypothetical protein